MLCIHHKLLALGICVLIAIRHDVHKVYFQVNVEAGADPGGVDRVASHPLYILLALFSCLYSVIQHARPTLGCFAHLPCQTPQQ